MLYDAQGKEIKDGAKAPPDGRLVRFEQSDRYDADVSRGLTPELVDRVLRAGNAGDIRDQARLALEIEEKGWSIFQALQTRRLAVAGLQWEITPADDSELAKRVAADVEAVLRAPSYEPADEDIQTFDQALVYELMGALLPGFSVVEILWGKGGKTIDGFVGIPQQHFTFVNSRSPLLVTTDNPNGIALPRSKFVYHRHFARSGDATRGGLIRPLAWLHCFHTLAGVKDLLRFTERYGMPFLVAKVNQQAWDQDRNRLKHLIRNFGADGGAVFTDAVTTELLQAANNQGDVYFRLLEYFDAAITKVIQGQTATSGDAGGLSKGQAQENVRQDLVAGDCQAIDATVTARLIRNWVQYNHGPSAPVPRMHHRYEADEDLKLTSGILVDLSNAGFEADEAEVSERFGFKLRRKAAAPAPSPAADGTLALSAVRAPVTVPAGSPAAQSPDAVADSALTMFLQGRGLEEWFGPLQVAIANALRGDPDEAEFKRRMQRLLAAIPDLMRDMDPSDFQDALARTIYTAAAGGMAARAAELS
jgi:phage gp29-like protein